jgi:hypothetical protein
MVEQPIRIINNIEAITKIVVIKGFDSELTRGWYWA